LIVRREEAARPNIFEVDLEAVAHNTAVVRGILGSNVRFFAALKANAYGFGLLEVAKTVLSSGADALSMSDLAHALALREAGVMAPILLYGGNLANLDVASTVQGRQIYPTVLDIQSAQVFSSYVKTSLPVFVKVDVGLERLGVIPQAAVEFTKAVMRLPRLQVEGIYAHMHIIDGEGAEKYARWQYDRFTKVLDGLVAAELSVPVRMVASSSVLRMGTTMNLNASDPGRVLYGLLRGAPDFLQTKLRPAFRSLRTKLIQVREFSRTEWISKSPFPTDNVSRLGVIPMGRADGLVALNSGCVLINGRRVRILGAPSLEHSRLDLSAVPDATVGDEVVIIGTQGQEQITIGEVLEHQGQPPVVSLALEVRDSVQRSYVTGQ
jgi:alanine racemase